jgi:hypothetical protein
MMVERAIGVDHSKVHWWMIKLVPLFEKTFRRRKRTALAIAGARPCARATSGSSAPRLEIRGRRLSATRNQRGIVCRLHDGQMKPVVVGNKSCIVTFDAKPVTAPLKQRAQVLDVASCRPHSRKTHRLDFKCTAPRTDYAGPGAVAA